MPDHQRAREILIASPGKRCSSRSERRAGAEVVDVRAHAALGRARARARGACTSSPRPRREVVLRDLEPQRPRVEPGARRAPRRSIGTKPGLGELAAGDVDADRQPRAAAAARASSASCAQAVVQHPAAERDDQPGLLGDRRGTPPARRSRRAVRPAAQRLEADDAARRRLHDRLVDDLQRAAARSRGAGRSPCRAGASPARACAASNTAWRPLPSALARYIATSASRSTSCGRGVGGRRARCRSTRR